jgi:RNA polymerase sigma factor (sigma-70 family)
VSAEQDPDAARDLDPLARRAAESDHEALSELVRRLQNPMFRLALRFLGDPHEAQDACQEVLIRIVTHLGSFEGRSKFTTWAYTVATRNLLRTKTRFVEAAVQGHEQFEAFLDGGMGDIDTTMEEAEYRLLCEEVRNVRARRNGVHQPHAVSLTNAETASGQVGESRRMDVRLEWQPILVGGEPRPHLVEQEEEFFISKSADPTH